MGKAHLVRAAMKFSPDTFVYRALETMIVLSVVVFVEHAVYRWITGCC